VNKILIVIACLLAVLLGCKAKAPIIECDLKNLMSSDTSFTNKSFTIKNTGNSDLIIEDFLTGCDCTTIGLKVGMHILPSDSLIVPVTITSSKKDNEKKKEISITIKTNALPRFTSFTFVYKNPFYSEQQL
jgi:Protein of unknown function (DUF1573)